MNEKIRKLMALLMALALGAALMASVLAIDASEDAETELSVEERVAYANAFLAAHVTQRKEAVSVSKEDEAAVVENSRESFTGAPEGFMEEAVSAIMKAVNGNTMLSKVYTPKTYIRYNSEKVEAYQYVNEGGVLFTVHYNRESGVWFEDDYGTTVEFGKLVNTEEGVWSTIIPAAYGVWVVMEYDFSECDDVMRVDMPVIGTNMTYRVWRHPGCGDQAEIVHITKFDTTYVAQASVNRAEVYAGLYGLGGITELPVSRHDSVKAA